MPRHTWQSLPGIGRFLFVSSGEVFDGGKRWYDETDAPAPINVYGATKLAAERIVLQNSRHTVVRIVLTAGTSLHRDRSFVEDMCRAAKAGSSITLYADEFRCPLPAGVIARAIWELISGRRTGLYHLGGSERLSRWEIGQLLVKWFPELQGRLVKGSSRDHTGAPRPADLSLSCNEDPASSVFSDSGDAILARRTNAPRTRSLGLPGNMNSDPLFLVVVGYGAMVVLMLVLWGVQMVFRNASIADVGFCAGLIAVVLWYARYASGETERKLLVALHGLRLCRPARPLSPLQSCDR